MQMNKILLAVAVLLMGILPLPYQVFYSGAKAALLSLTEGLAMELEGSGIQCCCILPGDKCFHG